MEKETIIKKWIGKNTETMYPKLNGQFSFNIFSMLFSILYFVYRKMYLEAFIIFIIQSIINYFTNHIVVHLICMVVYGFLFYPLYKMHIERKIQQLKLDTLAENEVEEICKTKGGTSITAVVIVVLSIVLILVTMFVTGMGMIIFDSATKEMENVLNHNDYQLDNNYDTNSNTSSKKSYSNNGITLKYNNKWQEKYMTTTQGNQKVIANSNNALIWAYTAQKDGINDYTLRENREELYEVFRDGLASEMTLTKQSYSFDYFYNGLYLAYFEVGVGEYMREYILLNPNDSTVAIVFAKSTSTLTGIEDEILEILKTIEF